MGIKQLSFLSSNELINNDQNKHHWSLFTDGASRNNPGKSGAGVYLIKDGEVAYQKGFFLGIKTNNQAEYLALLIGLFILNQYVDPRTDTVRVVSDSQLLVKQLKGEYAVKHPDLKPLHALAHTLLHNNHNVHIVHVLRIDNAEADKLANQGIDQKIALPTAFIEILHTHEITI